MKNRILLFVLVGLMTTFTFAQSKDEAKIDANVKKLYEAMVSQNKSVLENLTSEKLTYGHSSGTIEDKSEYVEAVLTGSFDFFSITPEEQKITVSGDTGIARHIFVANGTNNGEKADVRIGVMMTWQKKSGKWLLLARQAYKL